MRIFLAENGQKTGPFHPWEVRGRLERGEISPETMGWHEGCEAWTPVSRLPALGLPPSVEPPPIPVRALSGEDGVAGEPVAVGPGTVPFVTDRPRPWSRLAARFFDLMLWFTLTAVVVKPLGADFARLLFHPAFALSSPLLMLLAEAGCLAGFGTTPGKALLGLRVVAKGAGGRLLPFPLALQRSFLVYAAGNALYFIIYLTMGAWIFHYIGLMRHGATWWDRKLGLDVAGAPPTVRRVMVFVAAWLLMQACLNALVADDLLPFVEAMMKGEGG